MSTALVKITKEVSNASKRNLGIFAPVMQKASDPVQQLFLNVIKEFTSKYSAGKLVDPSPELLNEFNTDKERVYKQYKFKPGDDLTKFPSFKFTDTPIHKLKYS